MSHKGSWNRVKNRKAWDDCPLWKNKEKKNDETKHTDTDDTGPREATQSIEPKTGKADRNTIRSADRGTPSPE